MYKIFCDETWTANYSKCAFPCIVYYGVMIDEKDESDLLAQINNFQIARGLLIDGKYKELKWVKAEEEWNGAKSLGRISRCEEFLDIFFEALRCNKVSFACMFLEKDEYERVEKEFLEDQPDNKHNFFFMLYFQFLYHTFIKHQVKQKPCEIFIDDHDLGAEGHSYDIATLKNVLNRKLHKDYSPRYQLSLSAFLKRQLSESIHLVDIANSKEYPLMQMADLCAGCVRYLLENRITPPNDKRQPSLFEQVVYNQEPRSGKEALATLFYQKLRQIKGYESLNLLEGSYHYRFCVFPYRFV